MMRAFFRNAGLLLVMAALCIPTFAAQSKAVPGKPAAQAPILPEAFAGWEQTGTEQKGYDPRQLDAISAAVLGEDRFADFEIATYKVIDPNTANPKDGQRTLTLRAARFADAEGAYAAFTYYRQARMQKEDIGQLAASLNERVMFLQGNLLVDAQFSQLTAMSGAQLRELAGMLPKASGPVAELPTLPGRLPRKQLVPESAHFVIGPAAYAALNLDIPTTLINFEKNPKLLWARMNGESTASAEILMAEYPTHIIAIERLAAFQQLQPATGSTMVVKRTGPIVALVRGQISRRDAEHILASINYDASVTWNQDTGQAKRDNIGQLVVAGLTLAFVLFLISVGLGLMFGFGRSFLPRLWGSKKGQSRDDGDMIRLDLDRH